MREDVGQSDLEMIYDKFSHSNPLHDFSDIDISQDFKGSYQVSEEELALREDFMGRFYRGEVKRCNSFEK